MPIICVVCRAVDCFSENDLGELVCEECGTRHFESHQESMEAEDNTEVTRIRGKIITRKVSAKAKKAMLDAMRMDAEDEDEELTLAHCLRAMQTILQLQVEDLERFQRCSDCVRESVRHVWFGYLKWWQAFGSGDMMRHFYIDGSKERSIKRRKGLEDQPLGSEGETEEDTGPSPTPDGNDTDVEESEPPTQTEQAATQPVASTVPSMNLLLSILYFATRWNRSGITTSNLAFWAQQGELTFFSAFYRLPESAQKTLKPVKTFFIPERAPPPGRIALLTFQLADNLQINLPPLNHQLVALSFVQSLGLPMIVYERYLLLTTAIPGHDDVWILTSGEEASSSVHVSALLIVAIKITKGWHRWALVKDPQCPAEECQSMMRQITPVAGSGDEQTTAAAASSSSAASSYVPRVPWTRHDLEKMQRDEVSHYVKFCEEHIFSGSQVPADFADHVQDLKDFARQAEDEEDRALREENGRFPSAHEETEGQRKFVYHEHPVQWFDIDNAKELPEYFNPIYTEGEGPFHNCYSRILNHFARFIDAPSPMIHQLVARYDRLLEKRLLTFQSAIE